ncbi:MAG: hypothetical protein K6D59_01815 [Bacteroidales bacterium]|nr:hypothetical protein [Bacteroidales bacterium]
MTTVWIILYIGSITILPILIASNDTPSSSNNILKASITIAVVGVIISWIMPLCFIFVDNPVVFATAITIAVIEALAGLLMALREAFLGIVNFICWISFIALMIVSCNTYENPNTSHEYAWGRFYFTDKQAFCSPMIGDSNNFISFEEDSNHITFRCRCDNCGKRYSKHYHEQFTEKEWQEKQRLDSIFYDMTIPDYPY